MDSFNQVRGLSPENPLWLLLLIPLVLGLIFRYRSFYFTKVVFYLSPKREGGILRKIRLALPSFFSFLLLLFVVAALVDMGRGYFALSEKQAPQRIFATLDSSSSMYNFNTLGPPITCKDGASLYPRIEGACRAVHNLIKKVEDFGTTKQNKGGANLIAITQFATNSFVISYLTDDYEVLRRKFNEMGWRSPVVLGIYTNIHEATWDLFRLALSRNTEPGTTFTYLDGKEFKLLGEALSPRASVDFAPPALIEEKLKKIRGELRDTVFILVTDAVGHQMDKVLNTGPQSLKKLMQLAAFLELQVFFISTDEFHLELKQLARLTGFGEEGGKHRGDFLVVKQGDDFKSMTELVDDILRARFSLTTTEKTWRRESYSEWFIALSLLFALLVVVSRLITSRSLTNP